MTAIQLWGEEEALTKQGDITTTILCSIITQNLHCWVGSLHWFLQKYLLQQEHRCKAKFWGSAFSMHWFQNNNQFHTVRCFNTFTHRHTSTQTGTCTYSVLFPSLFLFLCSKNPKGFPVQLLKNPALSYLLQTLWKNHIPVWQLLSIYHSVSKKWVMLQKVLSPKRKEKHPWNQVNQLHPTTQ